MGRRKNNEQASQIARILAEELSRNILRSLREREERLHRQNPAPPPILPSDQTMVPKMEVEKSDLQITTAE